MSVVRAINDQISIVRPATATQPAGVLLPIGFEAPACGLAFRDLTETTLQDIAPDVVVAPLIASDFDALDLLDVLSAMNYRGRVRIHAPKLPNRQIVLRELRSVALRGGMSLELMDVA